MNLFIISLKQTYIEIIHYIHLTLNLFFIYIKKKQNKLRLLNYKQFLFKIQ
jgi:hypothetical protein